MSTNQECLNNKNLSNAHVLQAFPLTEWYGTAFDFQVKLYNNIVIKWNANEATLNITHNWIYPQEGGYIAIPNDRILFNEDDGRAITFNTPLTLKKEKDRMLRFFSVGGDSLKIWFGNNIQISYVCAGIVEGS
ncbi:hypothetical protein [Commensalibacter papalotli (ex Servin-Garciduenas et al. 2014)]|uniref:Uncharacterized protein n=1 Tax=Commensalibacter papalotli (ex Servin-Garciduenas et al. 2014) TaxID=1208583 RepID=W7E816_9PROT|nr:hypothetical protein [Commensalibacter papalotli (ex Servin-Garciduenas et al. 2014)]EUK19286.1 hypothetical protein COMX_06030 [Commensalibacter papalotli (ex Servin-Garciduenas et al. 2014)]